MDLGLVDSRFENLSSSSVFFCTQMGTNLYPDRSAGQSLGTKSTWWRFLGTKMCQIGYIIL